MKKKHFGVFLVHSNVHLLMTECMVEYVLSYLIAELPFKSFCFCLLEYYITFRYWRQRFKKYIRVINSRDVIVMPLCSSSWVLVTTQVICLAVMVSLCPSRLTSYRSLMPTSAQLYGTSQKYSAFNWLCQVRFATFFSNFSISVTVFQPAGIAPFFTELFHVVKLIMWRSFNDLTGWLEWHLACRSANLYWSTGMASGF